MIAFTLLCVAHHRRPDKVEAERIRVQRFFYRGAVRHKKLVRIGFLHFPEKAVNRNSPGPQPVRRVHCDNLRIHFHQLFNFLHRRRDVDRTSRIIPLHDADDRQIHLPLDLGNVLLRIGADSLCAALIRSQCETPHDKGRMHRLRRQRLAGNDKASLERPDFSFHRAVHRTSSFNCCDSNMS